MARQSFATTPLWLMIVVGLGLVTTVVVAVLVGFKAAVVTAAITLMAFGADRALLWFLGEESEPPEPTLPVEPVESSEPVEPGRPVKPGRAPE